MAAGSEIERLIQLLAKLPGLGPRSARRAALVLLKKRDLLLEPLAAAMQSATGRQLDGVLATLAPDFREILVLREMEDMSYAQIAKILELPIGTVMSRLARARVMLSDMLLPDGARTAQEVRR